MYGGKELNSSENLSSVGEQLVGWVLCWCPTEFVSLRASSLRADCEASRERLGAEVRKGELATITEEISFPLPLREGEYHWLKNDKLSINNH